MTRVILVPGRFDRDLPGRVLSDLAKAAGVMLHTEAVAGHGARERDRQSVIGSQPGWGFVHGGHELAISWMKSRRKLVSFDVVDVGSNKLTTGKRRREHLLVAQLERINTGRVETFAVAHFNRFWVDPLGWHRTVNAAVAHLATIRGPIMFGADYNRNWRNAAERRILRRKLARAGLRCVWERRRTVKGTHGNRLIDLVATRGYDVAGVEILPAASHSDHRSTYVDAPIKEITQ